MRRGPVKKESAWRRWRFWIIAFATIATLGAIVFMSLPTLIEAPARSLLATTQIEPPSTFPTPPAIQGLLDAWEQRASAPDGERWEVVLGWIGSDESWDEYSYYLGGDKPDAEETARTVREFESLFEPFDAALCQPDTWQFDSGRSRRGEIDPVVQAALVVRRLRDRASCAVSHPGLVRVAATREALAASTYGFRRPATSSHFLWCIGARDAAVRSWESVCSVERPSDSSVRPASAPPLDQEGRLQVVRSDLAELLEFLEANFDGRARTAVAVATIGGRSPTRWERALQRNIIARAYLATRRVGEAIESGAKGFPPGPFERVMQASLARHVVTNLADVIVNPYDFMDRQRRRCEERERLIDPFVSLMFGEEPALDAPIRIKVLADGRRVLYDASRDPTPTVELVDNPDPDSEESRGWYVLPKDLQ